MIVSLPLVVIALSFNLVSAERERGVLAIAVAAGASAPRFIVGKLLARALLVIGSLWLASLVAALAASACGSAAPRPCCRCSPGS